MFCKYCGKEIDDNSKFCQYCGKALEELSSSKKLKLPHVNKWVGYVYGIWVAMNALFIFLDGTNEDSRDALFPGCYYWKEPKWPHNFAVNARYYEPWAFNFRGYDITDFIVYAILLPFVLYILFKVISSLVKAINKKRASKKVENKKNTELEISVSNNKTSSKKKKSKKTKISSILLIISLIGVIAFFAYRASRNSNETKRIPKQEQSIHKKTGKVVYDEARDFSDSDNE